VKAFSPREHHHDRRLEAALQRCRRRLAGLTFSHGLNEHGIGTLTPFAHPPPALDTGPERGTC